MDLNGRVVLVTGASRGIGREIARAVADRGANLLIAARTLDPGGRLAGSLSETAALLRERGAEVEAIQVDLNDAEQVSAAAGQALAWKGRVDVLVNNAAFLGKATFHSLDELSLVNWQRQLNVNVTAPFLLAKFLVPAMRAAGQGAVVNVTSAAAELLEGDVPGIPYGATKAALNRLSLALARDLRPDGITVFAVDPGHVRTEISEQAATHPGWDIDIDQAHAPELAGRRIAELVQRPADEVSGKVWRVVGHGLPVVVHDGRTDR